MPKVWNISDHPGTTTPPKSMLLFGSTVVPGGSVSVPAGRASAAKKMSVREDVHVGDSLPADYLRAKGAYKAERHPKTKPGHVAPKGTEAPKVAKAKAYAAPAAKAEVKAKEFEEPKDRKAPKR
jgi:hypothetical protein